MSTFNKLMSTIVKPPPPPPTTRKFGGGGGGRDAYLIYKGKTPYTSRIKDKTTLVVFQRKDYAKTVRTILESHFIQYNAWPDLNEAMFSKITNERHGLLDIEYIDPFSIFDMCLRLNMNVCVVEDISEKNDKITIQCDLIDVEPRPETYRTTLEELYMAN